MKAITAILTALVLAFGAVASWAANVDRVSAQTGVPVATLQGERTSTGLGWGSLENANLIANASGQSFDTIMGKFHNGEGWGKIAHDYGLNLGHLVSAAHRSSRATMHAQNTKTTHGKDTTSAHGKSGTSVHGGMHSTGHTGSTGHMGSMSHMGSMGHRGGGHR